MPTLRPSELYQNCLELQSASCASTGRLENPGRVHRGRDDNCSILRALPFHELENEIDEGTHNAIPCPYGFSTSRIQVSNHSINYPSPQPGRCERHRGLG